MTTEQALCEYLVAQKVMKQGDSREDFYGASWFYATILGRSVPIFPRLGFRQGLPAHDTHHMLNGYATTWVGECETAAWELASGGCGPFVVYWFDRLFFLLIALAVAPVATLHAWQRGWGQRNVYRLDPEELLVMDIDEVRRYVTA